MEKKLSPTISLLLIQISHRPRLRLKLLKKTNLSKKTVNRSYLAIGVNYTEVAKKVKIKIMLRT